MIILDQKLTLIMLLYKIILTNCETNNFRLILIVNFPDYALKKYLKQSLYL